MSKGTLVIIQIDEGYASAKMLNPDIKEDIERIFHKLCFECICSCGTLIYSKQDHMDPWADVMEIGQLLSRVRDLRQCVQNIHVFRYDAHSNITNALFGS